MPFDPTKPVNNSPVVAAELRDQLNALKALIDAQGAQIADLQSALNGKTSPDDVTQLIQTLAAHNCANMPYQGITLSNPPTRDELQSIADTLDVTVTDIAGSAVSHDLGNILNPEGVPLAILEATKREDLVAVAKQCGFGPMTMTTLGPAAA